MRTVRSFLLLVLLFTVDRCPQNVYGFGIGISAKVNPTNSIDIELSSKGVREKLPGTIHSFLGNFLTKPPNAESIKQVETSSFNNVVLKSPPTVESTTSSSIEIESSSTTERRLEKTTESVGINNLHQGSIFNSRPSIVMDYIVSSTTERPVGINLGHVFVGPTLMDLETVGGVSTFVDPLTTVGKVNLTPGGIALNVSSKVTGIDLTPQVVGELAVSTSGASHSTLTQNVGTSALTTSEDSKVAQDGTVLNVVSDILGAVLGPKATNTAAASTSVTFDNSKSNFVDPYADIWASKVGSVGLGAGGDIALNVNSKLPEIVFEPKVTGEAIVSTSAISGGSMASQNSAAIGMTNVGTVGLVAGEKSNVAQEKVNLSILSKLPRIVEESEGAQQAAGDLTSEISGTSIALGTVGESKLPAQVAGSIVPSGEEIAVASVGTPVGTPIKDGILPPVASAASVTFEGSIGTDEALLPTADISDGIKITTLESVENSKPLTEELGLTVLTSDAGMHISEVVGDLAVTQVSAEPSHVTSDGTPASQTVQNLEGIGEATGASFISTVSEVGTTAGEQITASSSGNDVTTAFETIQESSSTVEGSVPTLTHLDGQVTSMASGTPADTNAAIGIDLTASIPNERPTSAIRHLSTDTSVDQLPAHEAIVPSHSATESQSPASNEPHATLADPTICTEVGNFSVAGNCRAYISCSAEAANFTRQICDCPERTAFSPLVRRCTRDISSCQDEQPACLKSGTISDPSNSSLYFWCIPSMVGGFHKYHVQCSTEGCLPEELHQATHKLPNSPQSDRDIAKCEWKQLKKELKVMAKVEKIRQKMEAKAKARVDKNVADKLKKKKRPTKKDDDSDDDDDEDDE